jgi:predicted DsbA family dithiol-disulfide isomerase
LVGLLPGSCCYNNQIVSNVITVDIWSDIACPWCYIGKRTFEAGLAAFRERHPDVAVAVAFRSFELSPDLPEDFDGTTADLLEGKGVPRDQVGPMLARVTAIAAEVGLRYDFDAVQPTRTAKAHQLLHHAKAHGRQAEMKERLMRAHFVEGRHVGRDAELADLAAEIGLDRDEVLRALADGTYAEAVEADRRQAAAYGIHAVPFFVIDGRYGLSGAQPAGTFAEVLVKAHAEGPSPAP